MLKQKIILPDELAKFGSVNNLNEQSIALVKQQCAVWDLPKKNFEALFGIQSRTFDFGHFKIIAQFNPERIRSSAAKTDAKTIAERPCFLCIKNLPQEQKGILFQNKYLILTNPFPIFETHLTISSLEHTPQLIENYFVDLLDLSKVLSDFTVFYNGPQCGASAPDHFHFQAGIKGLLPVEEEFDILNKDHSEILFQTENLKIIAVENYLRRFVAIISGDKKEIEKQFNKLVRFLDANENEEPMFNILCNFENGKWRVIILLREKQRPSHFFRTDKKQIIVGPAAVELGGVLVLPREEDFNKITKKEIAEIYGEVTINKESFEGFKLNIKNSI